MLGVVGDLVEDVVVFLHTSIAHASDTPSTVIRRRGGSAANVVATTCAAGGRARFIGQVGDDATGRWLCEQLVHDGAELAVRHMGRTGTVIALVEPGGERTMLSDRATATELTDPDPTWLDSLTTLHVPFYSLALEPLAGTTRTLARWAGERGIGVSIDTSSSSVLLAMGVTVALDAMSALSPSVVLANELEAEVLGRELCPERLGGATIVIKRGPDPALIMRPGRPPIEIPGLVIDDVDDTTGAGDAFAAGLLFALENGHPIEEAVRRGHAVAARYLHSGRDEPQRGTTATVGVARVGHHR